jgi:hypothetical protein
MVTFVLQILIILAGFALSLAAWRAAKGQGAASETIAALASAAAGIIREKLFELVLSAEREYGGGTGAVKRSAVLGALTDSPFYSALPDAVKARLNAGDLVSLINEAVESRLRPAQNSNAAVKALLNAGESDAEGGAQ